MDLASKKCEVCEGGTPPMDSKEIQNLITELNGNWEVIDNHHLAREFNFDDFEEALEFTNKIGKLAEKEGHHPDIKLSYGRVKVEIYTHKVEGLTESDFILAAKIDQL